VSVDLGDLTDLAIALGLLQPGGDPQPGWFADPAAHLKTMLTDPDQRTALLSALDDLLGGEVFTDSAGRTWLPVFENAPVAVYVVLDDAQPAVHVSLGVRVTVVPGSDEVGLDVEAVVPLFAAGGSSALLLGRPGASVEATMGITLPAGAGPGSVSLDSVEVSATIPTWGPLPQVGLSLRGLRRPGATSAQDVEVSAERIDELPGVLLDFVIALLHGATSSLPSGDAGRAFAGLLGLVDGDAVPQMPIDEVLASGPRALAGWWAQCLSGAARTDWLSYLATLLGGSLTGPGAHVTMEVPLPGGLTAVLDLTTTPGTSGLPVVTPKVTVQVSGAAGSTLELAVEPVSLDLATGTAVALPSLSALARVTSGGAGALLGPVSGPDGLQITVGSFEGGFALDAGRRPLLVLVALNAVVGSTPYHRLDLTDGDALAGVATQALETAAASLLDALGPLGDTVGVLLGLTDPPGGPAPRIDPVALLSDPVGAVRARWLDLLASPADTVREVLGIWQQATAAAAVRALPVTGDGSAGDPYTVAVADGVSLLLTQSDGAAPRSVVDVALAVVRTQPLALGAQVEAHVRIGLLQRISRCPRRPHRSAPG